MNPNPEPTRKRAVYRQRVADGVCVDCGRERAEDGVRRCAACGVKASKRAVKRQRKVQQALVKLHICRYCRTREPMAGRTYCGACAEVQIERQRNLEARRLKLGVCPRCGKVRDREGLSLCSHCQTLQNKRGRRFRRFRGKNLRQTRRLHPEAA